MTDIVDNIRKELAKVNESRIVDLGSLASVLIDAAREIEDYRRIAKRYKEEIEQLKDALNEEL